MMGNPAHSWITVCDWATVPWPVFVGGIVWLEPVSDKPESYQLQREGNLVFNWTVHL